MHNMLVWGSAGLKATQVHEIKGAQFLTSWKIPALVRGSAGLLTAHFHFMKKGMGLLCSSCGPCYEKCQAFYLFISCKMHALVWGVAGLLATHFHEMKNDRGGPLFHFMEKCIHIGCRAGSWFGHYCVHACSHGLDHGSR